MTYRMDAGNMRPSTSPDISIVQTVALNRSSSVKVLMNGQGHPTISVGSSIVGPRPPLARNPSQAKLNPLVASIPTQNSTMDGMVIAGSRTGEEKQVSIVERRTSLTSTPSSDNTQRRDNIHTKDQQRIRKLESDLKRLQDLLREKGQECDSLRSLVDSHKATALNMEVEKERNSHIQSAELEKKNTEIEALKSRITKLLSDMDSQNNNQSKLRKELESSLLEKIDQEKRKLDDEREKNKAAFKKREDEIRGEMSKWKVDLDAANITIRDLRMEVDKCNSRNKTDSKTRQDLEDTLRAEIRQLRGEIIGQQTTVEESRRQSKAFYDYMVSICQPQFTVVKDDHLTPMDPMSSTPQSLDGYVLVPLKLLLEGYGLLPTDIKKKIAEDYADDIKMGRIPAPSAGTFAIGKLEFPQGAAGNTMRKNSLRRSSEVK
eukprot:PhF_6_TR21221/c0_g1_i1/m.30662